MSGDDHFIKPDNDVVRLETFMANPLELEAATRAVIKVLDREGVTHTWQWAEDLAYQALKAAFMTKPEFDWEALQALRRSSK